MNSITSLFCDEGPARDRLRLLVALAAAAFWRLPLVIWPEVIHNDGIEYVRIARLAAEGIFGVGEVEPLYPVVVGLFGRLAGDFEIAGLIVSSLCGTLLTIPVFFLTRGLFNSKSAFTAALFAAFMPSFYVYSGSVLTETLYGLLLCSAVLCGWAGLDKGRFTSAILFGVFTTMAYLTRPEAVALLFIFCFWMLVVGPRAGRRGPVSRIGLAVLALASFIAFSSPYLLHIRSTTGEWGLSKKITISVGSRTPKENAVTQNKARRDKPKDVYIGTLVKDPAKLAGKAAWGLIQSLNKFQQALTPLLFFFAIVGFIMKVNGLWPWKANLYLLSHHAFFFAFVLPFFWITQRYTAHMIPITLPWAAYGFYGATAWLGRKALPARSMGSLQTLCLALVLAGLCVYGFVSNDRGHRAINRELGLWMKVNIGQGSSVLSHSAHEAFYAGLKWVPAKGSGYDAMVSEARSSGARYIVVDEELVPSFLKEWQARGGMRLLIDYRKDNERLLLFHVAGEGRD